MESTKYQMNINPKIGANLLSRMTFFWTFGIFKKGFTKNIELEDLYEAMPDDKSDKIGTVLEKHFLADMEKCAIRRKQMGISDPSAGPQPSLGRALLRTLWGQYLYLGFLAFLNEIACKLVTPILLGMLLRYFKPGSSMLYADALWCAGGIVLLNAASAISVNHFVCGAFVMGMRARIAVCSLIYRKSLKLSRTALGESAPGKVVNLLSNDVSRFDYSSLFLHYLWIGPLSAFLVLYFLWMEIGLSGVFGILVVFTVMPIQAYTGKLSAKFRLQTALKTDERVRLMGEIISGVQVIKMYAWEKPFQKLISLARKLEIKVIRKSSYVRGVYMTFLLSTTRIALFCVMVSMINFGIPLTSEKVFVVATYFNILSNTLSAMFVRAIAECAEGWVALKRLEKYLRHDEFIDTRHAIKTPTDPKHENGDVRNSSKPKEKYPIRIKRAEAKWLPEVVEPTLLIDTLDVKRGKLIGIIGPVGSGKSSLLQAMLGELPLSSGSMEVKGTVSYACQEPWVFGGSVRQNIIFGLPYEKTRYNEVVRVCALLRDFEQFPFGDQTLVGERGTTLSGGQKARVNLARAMYRQSDLYLMDDPLSAVDAHVGRHLFEQCILGYLRNKTRVLVTHQLHYLKDADYIVLLKDGKIEMQGTYQDISTSTLQYAQMMIPNNLIDAEELSEKGEDGDQVERSRLERSLSKTRVRRRTNRQNSSASQRAGLSDSTSSSMIDVSMEMKDEGDEEEEPGDKPQVAEAEASSINAVKGSMGLEYFKSGGNWLVMSLLFLSFVVSQILCSSADFWMAYWTSQEELHHYYDNQTISSAMTANATKDPINSTSAESWDPTFTVLADSFSLPSELDTVTDSMLDAMNSSRGAERVDIPSEDSLLTTETCIMVHGILVLGLVFFTFLRSFSFYNLCMKASQKIHDMMFRGVIRAPMLFFNTNPSGRIMNRFAKDMGAIDELLPKAYLDATQVLLQMFGSVALAAYVNPYFLIPIVVAFFIFIYIRKGYLKTSKNIKRLEGIGRSPVFTHLSTTLQGLPTIRAYRAETILKKEFDAFQDVHTSAWFLFIATSSAFGFVLDVLCLTFITFVIFSFLLISTDVLGDKVGLAITQCMSLTFMVQWGIRQTAEVANQLMAMERVYEYTLLPPENGIAPDEIDKKQKTSLALAKPHTVPPRDWPEQGQLTFRNLKMKYSEKPEAPYVLRGLNCEFKAKEKIGIVGRTGAGKSSLISALFRLAYSEGSVIIDGVDTQLISLEDLRRKISIIPQDPVLFSGTLRRNLDPFEEFSDTAVWRALEEVELKEAITGAAGLESRVLDEGSNFSVGQRQLVCLARAILRDNRLLMLDEATANVDPHTDNLIQKTIRSKFALCTVLTVAHRLNTIMDSDKVMVMDHGLMVEYGHPYILLQNTEGFLSKMAAETGAQNMEMLFNVAKEAYLSTHEYGDIKMIDE